MAKMSAEEWRVLSEYLDHALDLDESARDEWLSQLRNTDPAMAQCVIDAVIARGQAGFVFLDRKSVV